MTDEQILTLASKYLELQPIHGDVSVWDEWCGKPEDLLKFADEIRKCGWDGGFEYATEIHTDEINLLREELKKLGKVL